MSAADDAALSEALGMPQEAPPAWVGLAVVGLAFAFIFFRERREARYLAPRLSPAASRKRVAKLRKAGYRVRVLSSGIVLRSKVPVR